MRHSATQYRYSSFAGAAISPGMAAADDDDIEVVEGRAHGHASVGANAANLAGTAFRRKLARFLLYPYQHSAWHAKSDNRTEQGPVLRTPGTLEGRMSGDVRPSLFSAP